MHGVFVTRECRRRMTNSFDFTPSAFTLHFNYSFSGNNDDNNNI